MPVQISPEPFTHIYFADVFGADKANRNPVVCTPFSLSAGDLEARRFDLDGQFFEITPSATGFPTMRDKDVWLYCVSWLANAMFDERHKDLSRNLRFTARDFLDFSKRGNGGARFPEKGLLVARVMLATGTLALVENGTPKRARDLLKLPAKLDNRRQDGLGKKPLQNRILPFSRHDSQQLGVAQLNTPLR